MNKGQTERLEAKTPEQRFLHVLKRDFEQAPRVAQAVLEEEIAVSTSQLPDDQ